MVAHLAHLSGNFLGVGIGITRPAATTLRADGPKIPAPPKGTAMSRSARVAQIGLFLAIAAGIVLALAPIGYRNGWWPLRFSLYYGLVGAAAIGAVAVIVSLVGAFLT